MMMRCAASLPFEGEVPSQTTAEVTYRLVYDPTTGRGQCSCSANTYAVARHAEDPREHWCKHLEAHKKAGCPWREVTHGEPGEVYGWCPLCWGKLVIDSLEREWTDEEVAARVFARAADSAQWEGPDG